MPFQAPGNRAYGTLSASILASATSLVLTTGQGARFAAITAGNYFYLILADTNETDLNDNWEVVKVTARSSDTFTIERGFDHTSAKEFPRTPNNTVTRVRVFAPMSELQLRMYMNGGGAVVQAAMPTLTVDSPELLLLTPTAAGNLDLPTTNVFAGERFQVHNFSTDTADVITVRASGGTTVCLLEAGLSVVLRAIQDTPTTNAHWEPEGSYIDDSSLFVYGGTTTKHFKPMGAINADTAALNPGAGTGVTYGGYTVPADTMSENGAFFEFFGVFSRVAGLLSVDLDYGGAAVIDALDCQSSVDQLFSMLFVRSSSIQAKVCAMSRLPADNSGAGAVNFLKTSFSFSANHAQDNAILIRNQDTGQYQKEITATCLAR